MPDSDGSIASKLITWIFLTSYEHLSFLLKILRKISSKNPYPEAQKYSDSIAQRVSFDVNIM
jgi:hypothetical protein